MLETTGNIWMFWNQGHNIVIPTNLGWKRNGSNVMGAGLAKQAMEKFTGLPACYGAVCRQLAVGPVNGYHRIYYLPNEHLILAASKPLNVEQPWLSWQGKASYEVVYESLGELRDLAAKGTEFVLPVLGTGNGGLDYPTVVEMIRRMFLTISNVVLVTERT